MRPEIVSEHRAAPEHSAVQAPSAAVGLSHEAFAQPVKQAVAVKIDTPHAAEHGPAISAQGNSKIEVQTTSFSQGKGAGPAAAVQLPETASLASAGKTETVAPLHLDTAPPSSRQMEGSHQSSSHSAEKAPLPPEHKGGTAPPREHTPGGTGQNQPIDSHSHAGSSHKTGKTPCPPEHKPEPTPVHSNKPGKTPCPPEHKPEPTPVHSHKPGKTPCPPEHKPEPTHPHKPHKSPCPPGTPTAAPPETAPPVKTGPNGNPCPPEKTPTPAPPTKTPPEAPPASPQPTPPEAPPVSAPVPPVGQIPPIGQIPPVVPPVVPPVGQLPPAGKPPVNERSPQLVQWSPPAEPIKPFRPTDYVAPPAATSTSAPGQGDLQITLMSEAAATTTTARTTDTTRATDQFVATAGGTAGQYHSIEKSKATGHGKAGGNAAKESEGADVTTRSGHTRAAGGAAGEVKLVVRGDASKEEITTTEVTATTEKQSGSVTAKVEAATPAAQGTQIPEQNATYKSWAETTLSFSPHDKTTVGTATVGTFFNQQNYGYVQGTYDATRGRAGDVSAMYGHTLLSPYDANGEARRGNINVEAGVIVGSGEALEGSKLPIFGKTALRFGANGYYDLDKDGKNTVYGAVDFAGSPRQGDLQVGVSHKLSETVTIAGGYEVSKVDGYRATQFATTSVNFKLNDRAELYTGAAVSKEKAEDKVYAGVRIHF